MYEREWRLQGPQLLKLKVDFARNERPVDLPGDRMTSPPAPESLLKLAGQPSSPKANEVAAAFRAHRGWLEEGSPNQFSVLQRMFRIDAFPGWKTHWPAPAPRRA